VKVQVYNLNGKATKQIDIRDDVFAVSFNEAVVHQALVRQLADKRLGVADTKTRGEVAGSTRKMHAQKHTGRARRGDIRSPMLKGGGIAFGPHPRSYRQYMPKKMKKLAIRSMLSDKVQENLIKIVETFDQLEPRTKDIYNTLLLLGIDSTVLIATTPDDANVVVGAKNLEGVKTLPANLINVADLLSYKTLLMTRRAVEVVDQVWGERVQKNTGAGAD
jgi:large subunit ribosomal protein L4